jgi:hypothetical protein
MLAARAPHQRDAANISRREAAPDKLSPLGACERQPALEPPRIPGHGAPARAASAGPCADQG